MNRALLLLLGTGTMLGLNFPIGKFALAHGINPALWAAIISLGAGISMLLIALLRKTVKSNSDGMVKFAIVSGCLSYVMPNLLTFMVIPKIGSGLAAVMFALSPVATALISIVLRVRPPNLGGIGGIVLGLLGALIITFGRNTGLEANAIGWIMVALLIPVFLGFGNVYRTLAWPEGAAPDSLAAYTNLAAVPFLVAIFIFTGFDLTPLGSLGGLIVLQVVVSTIMFLMFFHLQHIGGPTYLSQIGYVAAAVGLFIGASYLGEIYPLSVWIGAGVVVIGIAVSTWSGLKKT
jgi:drug/metabolite transporter (DMT)-like permease